MSTAKETLKIDKVNQYGFKSGDKQYNKSKFFKGEIVEGQVVVADVYTSDKGAKYVNTIESVVSGTGNVPATPTPEKAGDDKVVHQKPLKAENDRPVKYGKPLSDYEMDLDKRISNAGLIQALVQSPALAAMSNDIDEWYGNVLKILGKLKEEVKK